MTTAAQKTICIFNPEHDLCLANGDRHYVPPMSALSFSRSAAPLMKALYPDASCFASCDIPMFDSLGIDNAAIVPWGWNKMIKEQLSKLGFPIESMPSDETLAHWRRLQHRSTLLPMQPACRAATCTKDAEQMILQHHDIVMKAPWSGSGRGIRWVSGALSEHDILWMHKIIRSQECVILEPRCRVAENFALEYQISNGGITLIGYSLFNSSSGVYQGNILFPDNQIQERVHFNDIERRELEEWLLTNIAPFYQGPLGVDYLLDDKGNHHLCELNLRHTMGLVAHEYLRRHPDSMGSIFSPTPGKAF